MVSVELIPPLRPDEPDAAGEVDELSLPTSLEESDGSSGFKFIETRTDAASKS